MAEELEPEERIEAALRQQFGWLYDTFCQILYTHDPIMLARHGAPSDEYSVEVDSILPHLHDAHSPEELAQIVYAVFVQKFDASMAGTQSKYSIVGQDLWRAYQRWLNEQPSADK